MEKGSVRIFPSRISTMFEDCPSFRLSVPRQPQRPSTHGAEKNQQQAGAHDEHRQLGDAVPLREHLPVGPGAGTSGLYPLHCNARSAAAAHRLSPASWSISGFDQRQHFLRLERAAEAFVGKLTGLEQRRQRLGRRSTEALGERLTKESTSLRNHQEWKTSSQPGRV